MRRAWIIAIPLLVALVLLLGMGVGACGSGVEEEETPTLPKPGEWVASTECSEFTFTFTVSPDSVGIAKISYDFNEFKCPGAQHSGGVSVERPNLWPITNGQFTVDTYIKSASPLDIVIQGRFDGTGMHASGTWEIGAEGTTCSAGSWEASH
jgi:hypothetical protein